MKKIFITMLMLMLVFIPQTVFADQEEMPEETQEVVTEEEPEASGDVEEESKDTEVISEDAGKVVEDPVIENEIPIQTDPDQTDAEEELSESSEEEFDEELSEDPEDVPDETLCAAEDVMVLLKKAVARAKKSDGYTDVSDLQIPASMELTLSIMLSDLSDDVSISSENGILSEIWLYDCIEEENRESEKKHEPKKYETEEPVIEDNDTVVTDIPTEKEEFSAAETQAKANEEKPDREIPEISFDGLFLAVAMLLKKIM